MLKFHEIPHRLSYGITLVAAAALPGCSTLPSSGPTAAQIVKRAKAPDKEFRFNIVPLDSKAVDTLNAAQEARISSMATLMSLAIPSKAAALGPGDVLNLSLIHISEPTRLLSISYAVFCLKKKKQSGGAEAIADKFLD